MIYQSHNYQNNRNAFVMLLFGLVMPCIIGMLALIVDGGLAMNNQRRLQNIADSIATSVANRYVRGSTSAQCIAAANEIVPVFILDENLIKESGSKRLSYLGASLRELDKSLDGNLHICVGDQVKVLKDLIDRYGASEVHISEEFADKRHSRK